MIVAPNSPRPRAKARASPAASPPRASGSTTRKKVRPGPAPSVRAAATTSGSTASKAAIACRTYSGLDTKATASTTAVSVNGMLVPSSPARPKSASSPIPATAGGSTSGSSTSVITSARPRKRPLAAAEAPARDQVCERRAEQNDQRLGDQRRLGADDQRIGHDRARQLVEQLPRRDAQKDRRHRQHEEREGAAGGRDRERREQRALHGVRFRKP